MLSFSEFGFDDFLLGFFDRYRKDFVKVKRELPVSIECLISFVFG